MSLPLLLAACLLPLAQDAAETPAPAGTDPAVRAFMQDIQARLYMPEDAGLQSLEFDVDFEQPMMGKVATAHTNWSTAGGTAVDVQMLDFDVPAQLAAMYGGDAEGMKQSMVQNMPAALTVQAEQLVTNVLNRYVSDMVEDYDLSLDGASDDGLVVVGLVKKPESRAEFAKASLFVDDESVVRRIETTSEAMGQTIPITIHFHWKPASGQASGLVVDYQELIVTFNMGMGDMEQKQTITYGYRSVRDMVILETITTKMAAMPGMGGDQVSEQRLRNLVVNGQMVSPPAAPAPEAPAVEPAEG